MEQIESVSLLNTEVHPSNVLFRELRNPTHGIPDAVILKVLILGGEIQLN